MNNQPSIEIFPETIVIGKHLNMSLSNNLTVQLWKSFMPVLNSVLGRINDDLLSLQIYQEDYSFDTFNPSRTFTKWACAPVSSTKEIPQGMNTLTIPKGLYAVFIHYGPASEAVRTFGYIFGEWIPNSIYQVDTRPHFEVLGKRYKNNDINSEEEVWIPIRVKDTE